MTAIRISLSVVEGENCAQLNRDGKQRAGRP
jgi:hypothetical protein